LSTEDLAKIEILGHALGMESKTQRHGLLILLTVASIYGLIFMERTAPGLVTPELLRRFHLVPTTLTLMTVGQYFIYALMQVPVAVGGTRYRPELLLLVGTVADGLGTLLFSWSPSFFWIVTSRVVVGFGDALIWLNIVAVLGRWFGHRVFGRVLGLTSMSGSLGALAATVPLAFWIDQSGWRLPFTILGAGLIFLAGLSALVFFFWTPINPDWQSRHDKLPWRQVLTSGRRLTGPMLSHFGFLGPFLGFISVFAVPYLRAAYHLSEVGASTFLAFGLVGSLIGGPVAGILADRYGVALPYRAVAGVNVLAWAALAIFPRHLPTPVLAIVFIGLGFCNGASVLTFAAIRALFQPDQGALASGLANSFGFFSAVLVALVMGLALPAGTLADHTEFVVLLPFCVLGGMGPFLIPRQDALDRRPAPKSPAPRTHE